MPAIPLPFVIALLLLILLVRLLLHKEDRQPATIIFLCTCLVLVTTVGLRWTFDWRVLRFLQPVVASVLPPVAWLCFSAPGQMQATRIWPHVVPVMLILVLSATWLQWHPPIDLVLATIFFLYGLALLQLASAGPDGFAAVRFSDVPKVRKAASLAGLLLLGTGMTDLLIAVDFDLYRGSHAGLIVGMANLVTLPLVAWATVVVGRAIPADNAAAPSASAGEAAADNPPNDGDHARILETLDALMRNRAPFRDPDLTLNRLSRKVGIPARQISRAINGRLERNVSQWVNDYRVEEAQRLLRETDLPVTSIVFECGFQTKSNFNREFSRVSGMSPSDYRRLKATPRECLLLPHRN